MHRLMAAIGAGYLLSQGFDALLRWVLDLAKIAPLIYARDGAMIFAIVLGFVDVVAHRRDAIAPFALLTFMIVSTVISTASGLPFQQIMFGVKVWLPLMLGFLLISSGAVNLLHRPRALERIWLLLVIGIVINVWVTYPWTGLTISVGDTQVVANREWSTQGFSRVSGFSRSSFDGAIAVQLLAMYLMVTLESPSRRLFIWLMTGVAIVLTISKGAIMSFVIATALLPLVMTVRPEFAAQQKGRRYLACAVVSTVALIGFLMPLLSGYFTFVEVEQGTVEYLLFASFGDRVSITWPNAFALLDAWQYVTGRGIGGIGVAQSLFELDRYCPADNFFVYLYITAGLVGAGFYLGLLAGLWTLDLGRAVSRLVFLVLVFAFAYGATTNLVESAMLLVAMGAVAAQLVARQPVHQHAVDDYYYPEYGT